jgi:hypothetical protein
MSNFTNYRIAFTSFFASSITTHIRLINAREESHQTTPRLMEEFTFEKAPKRFYFEENNYIIEPRQMAKYFFSMLMALINERRGLFTGANC